MSGPKLIFSFKDGLNLALDKKKASQGGIVNFDLDYGQVNVDYEGPLMSIVSRREKEGLPSLLNISAREESSLKRQRVESIQYPMERTSQLQSMITTPTGDLVGISADRVPDAPLRRTQRRNANRRKHRAFVRMEKRRAREAETAPTPVREERIDSPSLRATSTNLPVTEDEPESVVERTQLDVPDELCSGCPTCNVEIPRRSSAAGTFTECPDCNVLHLERYVTFEEYTAASMKFRSSEHPEVEPYIPQFAVTPQFQIPSEVEIVEPPRREYRIPTAELERMSRVRKEEFEFYEEVQGKLVNILEGLELHTGVFSERDERRILDCVFDLRDRGRAGLLMKKTYSEPQKWMRGKGRITIQCGCCYNFAKDRLGNPPGILRYDEVDPLPSEIKRMIKRMVRWSILPADCVPNSCIINIYEEGDCIPPHIDHHDFVRPFCTVSFMSKSNILFGREIDIVGPGEFRGSVEIPLPVGSVLILKGNGADLAKHCIPGVPHRRVSVTLRRMDDSKVPHGFQPDPELEELRPY